MASIVIIGGGAAGIFSAIIAKATNPENSVIVLEKTAQLLSKVRISGGGRCNVTHACFDPKLLIQNYPRGGKELQGPFNRFQPKDTVEWFESHGVKLKTEEDGRMFPTTDDSQTIINCLLTEAGKLGVEIRKTQKIEKITKEANQFILVLQTGETMSCDKLILATGSSPQGFQWAQAFGHTIQKPVPSLFTFNIPTSPLLDLGGISVNPVTVSIPEANLKQSGPILLTHWGFSGPAVLKLSAWGARYFAEKEYRTQIKINWLSAPIDWQQVKAKAPQKLLANENPSHLPKNLWKRLMHKINLENKRFADLSNSDCQNLSQLLQGDSYQVEGKTTYKEEFVTCGGVTLKEVDFRTIESRITPSLFFAGEILDIDGITGGFNFQNAWTTGWIAGKG